MTAELLTVEQFREHVKTAAGDDAVQRYLDACEDAINRHCGTLSLDEYAVPEEVTEWYTPRPFMTMLPLRQQPDTITSVTLVTTLTDLSDEETELVEDDEYWVEGSNLRRKDGYFWGSRVRVVYTPADTAARRRAVLIKMVQLELNADPGSGFEGAGSWQHTSQDYETQHQALLWSLCRPKWFA